MTCPLCRDGGPKTALRVQDGRDFFHCMLCDLVFQNPRTLPTPAQERATYEHHENDPADAGYVAFLNQLAVPLADYLESDMRGVDFGSGPGPTLSGLLPCPCDDYDPIFGPRELHPPYDFLVSTECFEHFHRPYIDISTIKDLVRPDGIIGVMTLLWNDIDAIPAWHYARDPTHTTFYHLRTFDFMADAFGFRLLWTDGRRVMILKRS